MNQDDEESDVLERDPIDIAEGGDVNGALSTILGNAQPQSTAGGLETASPAAALQMGKERMHQLTELKQQMKIQAQARQAAMERAAQAYAAPIDTGMDPGLIALGQGMASHPGITGFTEGMAGMQAAKQKLAERDWARKAAAERMRVQAEQNNMTDLLNQAKLDVGMRGYGRSGSNIKDYTNANGERVQVVTDPYTGETTQTVLGRTQGRIGEAAKLKAGFQWAKNSDGTPMMDENGMPMQAKVSTLSSGTVPGSTASGDVPEKGWSLYTDGATTFRINQNAGLAQKQTAAGWEPTDQIPSNVKKFGAGEAAKSSALNQRYAGRVIGASNEGLAALSTIAGMGDPNTGLFGSKNPENIFSRAGAGLLTPEATKRYNATVAGLAVEIATAQNQGMVPNQDQIKHVETGITITPTDDETTRKYRIALAARYLDKALETSRDLASDKQHETIDRIRGQLKEFPDPNSLLNLKPEKHMFVKEKANQGVDTNVESRGPVEIYSDADYEALPSGTVFLPPGGGKPRRKP